MCLGAQGLRPQQRSSCATVRVVVTLPVRVYTDTTAAGGGEEAGAQASSGSNRTQGQVQDHPGPARPGPPY